MNRVFGVLGKVAQVGFASIRAARAIWLPYAWWDWSTLPSSAWSLGISRRDIRTQRNLPSLGPFGSIASSDGRRGWSKLTSHRLAFLGS